MLLLRRSPWGYRPPHFGVQFLLRLLDEYRLLFRIERPCSTGRATSALSHTGGRGSREPGAKGNAVHRRHWVVFLFVCVVGGLGVAVVRPEPTARSSFIDAAVQQ
jgi:hypothetical protein